MNKISTSIRQSQKLMELGIAVNTADMCWQNNEFPVGFNDDEAVPAWSLSALLSFLPFDLIINNRRYIFSMCKSFDENGETYAIKYAIFNTTFYLHLTDFYNNPIDAAFEMVVWLKENNQI